MIRTLPAIAFCQNVDELLNEVQYRRDSIVITRAGKPVAALVDVHLFEKIHQMKEHFEKLTKELGKAYQDVNAETANQEIAEAVNSTKKTQRSSGSLGFTLVDSHQ